MARATSISPAQLLHLRLHAVDVLLHFVDQRAEDEGDDACSAADFVVFAHGLDVRFDRGRLAAERGGNSLGPATTTECTGGARGLSEEDLTRAYRTQVDPRLNYEQALEMAMIIARRVS